LKLDGKPKALPEKLGSAVVKVANDSRATIEIGRLQYITAEKVAVENRVDRELSRRVQKPQVGVFG
jgi:hypothetical protein